MKKKYIIGNWKIELNQKESLQTIKKITNYIKQHPTNLLNKKIVCHYKFLKSSSINLMVDSTSWALKKLMFSSPNLHEKQPFSVSKFTIQMPVGLAPSFFTLVTHLWITISNSMAYFLKIGSVGGMKRSCS